MVRSRLDASRGQVWQLYHDYLARAIVTLERKGRKWQIQLAESAKGFERAVGLWGKWQALLKPRVQIRFLWEKFQGRLSYGPFRWYALSSLPLLALNVPVIVAVLSLYTLHSYLAGQAEVRALRIANSFDGEQKINASELFALWELAGASEPVRQRALQEFVSNPDKSKQFLLHEGAVLLAAGGLDPKLGRSLADTVLADNCYREELFPDNRNVIKACGSLALVLDARADRAATFLVNAMNRDDQDTLLDSSRRYNQKLWMSS